MDSLKKRYFIKLVKSISDALIKVGILLFVPRVLGPAAYGSFNYIRDSFQSIIALLDLNLGSAHVNYAARKHNSSTGTNLYFTYMVAIGILLAGFLFIIITTGLYRNLFPGQSPHFLYIGALLAYLMYIHNALMGLSDSKGATYGFEVRSILININLFIVLLLMYVVDALDLVSFFAQRLLLYALFLCFGVHYLFRKIHLRPVFANFKSDETRNVLRGFFSFAHPLIFLSGVGIVFTLFDRWFLQFVYGSVSQGFFSLAFSVSSIAGLFLSPMTPLLMQSVAVADEGGDIVGIRDAFEKVKVLYLIGALLAIYFMFHSAEIISLVGGEDYAEAKVTVIVMFLYPIHVVYGQFCGGVLIALRRTGLYRDIALFSTIAGFLLTYILLAPTTFTLPGLELNSLGLAIKLVMVQLISVTIQLHFVCRIVGARVREHLLSQVLIPIPIVLIAMLELVIRSFYVIPLNNTLAVLVFTSVSLAFWILSICLIIWSYPGLIGLDRSVMRELLNQLLRQLRDGKK